MDSATGNTISKTKAGTFFGTSTSTAIPNSGTSTSTAIPNSWTYTSTDMEEIGTNKSHVLVNP